METDAVAHGQTEADGSTMLGAAPGEIAVFVNPHSRANRRNPKLGAEFQTILGDQGRVLAPRSLAELEDAALALHAAPPATIAVHGGDGTLHKVLTAIGRAWGDDPLPPIAVLCGGTMNVVASSLRIRERPATFLRSMVDAARAGRTMETLRRRCLRVGRTGGQLGSEAGADKLGFVFGNGLLANFLGEYYATGSYGPGRAVWLLARTFFSALVRGPFARRVFRRFEGTVRVDGVPLERNVLVGVGAGTVSEVGLGFKLNHRADEDPERFSVLAIHAPPLALVPDIPAVHGGRGIAPSHAFSAVASVVEVEPATGNGTAPGTEMSYTVDGDLYREKGPWPLRIAVGPPVLLVKPERALIVAGAQDTIKPR